MSEDGELVVIPDLIYWHMIHGTPQFPAVELVGKALLDRLPGVRVYLTRPCQFARLVTDEIVFREGKPHRPQSIQPRATARGFIAGYEGPRHKLVVVREQKAVPRLAGARDLLVEMFTHWRQTTRNPAGLYRTAVWRGMPAILLADAEEVFGYNVGAPKLTQPAKQAGQAPTVVDLVSERKARAWEVAMGRGVSGAWQSCHVDAVNELRALKVSDTEIARSLDISRTRLQQECGTRSEAEAGKTAGRAVMSAALQSLTK